MRKVSSLFIQATLATILLAISLNAHASADLNSNDDSKTSGNAIIIANEIGHSGVETRPRGRSGGNTLAELMLIDDNDADDEHHDENDETFSAGDHVEPGAGETEEIGLDNSNEAGLQLDRFGIKCFIQRGPAVRKSPRLHFYSTKTHSDKTRACGPNLEIKLKATNHGDSPQVSNIDQIKQLLIDSHLFDPKAPTYFVLHGFLSTWKKRPWLCNLKDLILDNSRANVFLVDWSGGSNPLMPLDYAAAVGSLPFVGTLLGSFVRSLIELTGQPDASQYHMIGHSLAAHICGYAGYHLDGTLGRITALDPAKLCFVADASHVESAANDGYLDRESSGGGKRRRRRLSRQSAKLVVALHTDSTIGLEQNCAHYDIYVNGARRQPKRSSKSNIAAQCQGVGRLLSRTLSSSIRAINFANNHRYVVEILNKLDIVGGGGASGAQGHKSGADRCYPMAYECRDWKAFKAGECGFCRDGDSRCIFTGVSLISAKTTKRVQSCVYQRKVSLAPVVYDEDDGLFNDEDEYDHDGALCPNPSSASGSGSAPGSGSNLDEQYELVDRSSRGKHFIRSGPPPVTCMFQYQIVIAAKKQALASRINSDKHQYYLQIPLELSGKLNGEQGQLLHYRLVQVSHRIRHESTAYRYFVSTYMDALRESSDAIPELDSSDALEFFTALITFEPAGQADECRDDPTNGAGINGKRRICSPLDNIQEACLWSSSEAKLEAVLWIGMNYMSGLNYEQRLKESYVFSRIAGQPIRARDSVPKKAHLDRKASISKTMASAAKSLDRLLSVFDGANGQDPRHGFKNERSRKELLYSASLKPFRLG